jgi:hypothetical protein
MVQAVRPLLLIVDLDGSDPTQCCYGPDAAGTCPTAQRGELVPCAGKQLVAPNNSLSPMASRMVWEGEDECPLPIMLAGGG